MCKNSNFKIFYFNIIDKQFKIEYLDISEG